MKILPVCVRIWMTSLSDLAKLRSHKLQQNGFSPVCCLWNKQMEWSQFNKKIKFQFNCSIYLMWMVKSVVRGYPFPQTLQKLVIFPEWRLICTAKLLIELQLLPQTLHKITFLFSLSTINGPVRFLWDLICTNRWFECFIRLPHMLHS